MKKHEAVKITEFHVENVKRVRAVHANVNGKALTVIGGNNGNGKTSVLDAIMWTLAGDRYKPSAPIRDGAEAMATKVTLTNGLIVERRGVNGSLKITKAGAGKASAGGQNLLNEFISALALDLGKFMSCTDKQRADMLLELFPGLGAELGRLNQEAERLYQERHGIGVVCERKRKHAQEMVHHEDVPETLLTGSEMTQRLQDQLAQNAENDRLRREVRTVRIDRDNAAAKVESARKALAAAEAELAEQDARLKVAESQAEGLVDADTTALQAELERIDGINAKVRENLDRAKALSDAEELGEQYKEATAALEQVRADRMKLLAGLDLPYPDLSIDTDGALLYKARRWDSMSGAEQLRVAVAICSAIKPECGFVLIDGLERMDADQLADFGTWLHERGLQAIGTRVGDGKEATLIIEDGMVAEYRDGTDEPTHEPTADIDQW